MSILSVVKDVCMVIGVNPPTTMFGADLQPRTQAELLALANEMAQRIAYDGREWTQMKAFAVLSGPGTLDPLGAAHYPLPANYLRMLLTAQVWPSWIPRQPLSFIADTDEWLMRRQAQIATTYNEWTLIGTDFVLFPALTGTQTVSFAYLEKNCIDLRSPLDVQNGYSDLFSTDMDRFRLPERLLKLGMIWQWKANKGSPYAEDMGTYTDAFMTLAGANKPAPIIADHTALNAPGATLALPWPVGWGAGATTQP